MGLWLSSRSLSLPQASLIDIPKLLDVLMKQVWKKFVVGLRSRHRFEGYSLFAGICDNSCLSNINLLNLGHIIIPLYSVRVLLLFLRLLPSNSDD